MDIYAYTYSALRRPIDFIDDKLAKFFTRQAEGQKTVLAFMYLVQDLDVLLPVLRSLKGRGANVLVSVAGDLLNRSPRVKTALEAEAIPYFQLSGWMMRTGVLPNLGLAHALLTAADTSASAHQPARRLVRYAKALGLRTYTFQHGFENIGLNYSDQEYPIERTEFASETVFTWGSLDSVHPSVSEKTRSKCVPLGCPKDYDLNRIPTISFEHGREKLVVVFENLHWNRYSESYRSRFLADLAAQSDRIPEATLLVKPHHAGRWLTDRFKGSLPSRHNLIIANPSDQRWEPFTAPALIKMADAVVTTPSTTAFDAACLDKPVAAVAYDLDLPHYAPLPLLSSADDWTHFFKQAFSETGGKSLQNRVRQFRQKAAVAVDTSEKISEYILRDLQKSI